MSERLHDALEVCLQALATGVEPEACLSLYPDLAVELQPLLQAALDMQSLRTETIPKQTYARSRAAVLAKVNDLEHQPDTASRKIWGMPRFALAGLAFVLGLVLGGWGLLEASAETIPGDTLYPVKRAAESIHWNFVPEWEVRDDLEDRLQKRRIEEVETLLALDRVGRVTFEGTLLEQSGNQWNVDDITVVLTPETTITGQIAVGAVIRVRGETQPEGWVKATELSLRRFEFTGFVEEISPEHWIVSRTELLINEQTILGKGLGLGDLVVAFVEAQEGEGLVATRITGIRLPSPTPPVGPPTPDSPTPESERTSPGRDEDEQEVRFEGEVQSIGSSEWIVDDRIVLVNVETEIDEGIQRGDRVEVRGHQSLGGAVLATDIRFSDEEEPRDDDQKEGDSDEEDGEDEEDETEEVEEEDETDEDDEKEDDEHEPSS